MIDIEKWKQLDSYLKRRLKTPISRGELRALLDEVIATLTEAGVLGETEHPFVKNKTVDILYALKDRSLEVLPGLYSGTGKYLSFKSDLLRALYAHYGEPELDEFGMCGPDGYAHDFSKMTAVPGFVPNTAGATPLDNRHHRKLMGLPDGWQKEEHKVLAEQFFTLLFGLATSSSVRIKAKSSSGAPDYFYDKGLKMLSFMNAVEHLEEVTELASRGDMHALMSDYRICFLFNQGNRQSPDYADKVRKVVPRKFALQPVYDEVEVDKSISIEGVSTKLTDEFGAMRYRYVFGQNNTVNSIINSIGGSVRSVYGSVFEFTFKHRGIKHLDQKLNDFAIKRGIRDSKLCRMLFLDITSYDRAMSSVFLETMVSFFEGTSMHDFIKRSVFCPTFIRCNDKGTKNEDLEGFLSGDPLSFNPDDFVHQGLMSGWAWVSDAGKWAALVVFLIAVDAKIVEPTLDDLVRFLRGDHVIGCFNLGDDNCVFGEASLMERFQDQMANNSYWQFDIEKGSRFIGLICCHDGENWYKFVNDKVSYLQNLLTPERDFRSTLNPRKAEGVLRRRGAFDAPGLDFDSRLLNELWYAHMGTSFTEVMNEEADKLPSLVINGEDMSVLLTAEGEDPELKAYILAELDRDPSVLDYKFSPEDFYRAFGISIHDLEGRPDVSYSIKVLKHAGYKPLSESEFKDLIPFEVNSEASRFMFVSDRIVEIWPLIGEDSQRFILKEWLDSGILASDYLINNNSNN